jgi:hypothetical protein
VLFNVFVELIFLALIILGALVTLIASATIFFLFILPLLAVYGFLVFFNSEKRAQAAQKKLMNTLIADEKLIIHALQLRIFALSRRRQLIALTNSRVIEIQRGLLGGFKMFDAQWKDLHNAKLSENAFPKTLGSNLEFNFEYTEARDNQKKAQISTYGIPLEIASAMYSEAQSREQEWIEKRRIRDLEAKRAAAGGVVLHSNKDGGAPLAADQSSIFDALDRLKKLLDVGAISDTEFQEMKSKLLSKVTGF